MKRAAIAFVAAASCAIPTAGIAAEAAPITISKAQAMKLFAGSLVVCWASRRAGDSIATAPAALHSQFHPATAEERSQTSIRDARIPLWIHDTLGTHLIISEPSADRCNVTADQLPVDETFKTAIGLIEKFQPDFVADTVKPGYNPIVYQIERHEGPSRQIIHLEGAEPGAFGHAYRYGLLQGWITVDRPAVTSTEPQTKQ